MFRRILVPLDGSPFGDHALPYAAAIAARAGAEIELVHAHQFHQEASQLESLTPYRFEGITDAEELLDGRDWNDELDRLNERADELRRSGIRASARVIHGPALRALPPHAHDIDADLVVMSTHGHGGEGHRLLGGVADHLVRHVTTPVLLVRPPSENPPPPRTPRFEHVLVPLDGSTLAEEVLPSARTLGRPFASRLTLLRVLHDRGHWPLHRADEQLERARRKDEARAELAAVSRRFEHEWVRADIALATHADAAPAILDAADRLGADVVAMATHGRSGLPRLVLGSVADRILRTASVPLLLFGPAAARRRLAERLSASESVEAMLV